MYILTASFLRLYANHGMALFQKAFIFYVTDRHYFVMQYGATD